MDVSPRTQALWQRMAELSRELVDGSEGLSALAALELTVPQSMVLFRLADGGPLTITQLRAVAGRSQAATSNLVTQLEARRLVTRATDAADGRRTVVTATPRGKALIDQVQGFRARALEKALARIPATTVRKFDAALEEMLRALRSTTASRRTP